jgi:predicted nucleic acid-binding Zn ribbon protein
MSYTRPPKAFEGVLDALYHHLKFDETADEFRAVKLWSDVVGAHIARVSEVEKIVNGMLFVKVRNSAWRNELTFKKPGIIAQLNSRIGRDLVKDIVFK